MDKEKIEEFTRSTPSEKGTNNDPHAPDESARQPGINTISSSDSDSANQNVTKSAGDSFKTPFGQDADTTYDDAGDKDVNK